MDITDTSHDDDEDEDDDTDDPSQRSVWVLGASPTQLESFQEDVQYLWAPFVDSSTSTSTTTTTTTIPIYETPPSSLNFLRNHVAVSRPCIIRNSILVPTVDATVDVDTDTDDPSCTGVVPLQLTLDDLVERFPDNHNGGGNDDDKKASPSPSPLPLLIVDVTPDGHGDCLRKVAVAVAVPDDDDDDDENDILGRKKEVIQKVFVKPLEQEMSLSTFRHHLRQGRHKQQHEGGRGGRRRRNNDTISSRVFVEEEALLTTDKKKDEDTVDVEGDATATATATDTDFLDDCVLYYSRQNDCLREELLPLWNAKVNSSSISSSSSLNDNNKTDTGPQYLFPRSFPWAEEAFFGESPPPPHQTRETTTTTTTTNHERGPEACNIWIGDERVVSSMHKDYYENLFYVASGEKVFHLCPPSDIPFLYEQEVISGRFQHHRPSPHPVDSDADDDDETPTPRRTKRWTVALDREEEDPGEDIVGTTTTTSSNEHEHKHVVSTSNEKKKKYSKVRWIAADPFACPKDNDDDFNDDDDTEGEEEDHQQERTTEVNASMSSSSLYPLSRYAHPITVTVQAGELLYVPSLWFHRVTQTCETIGINYWYDMNFESPLYCYFHFLQQLHTTTSTTTRQHPTTSDTEPRQSRE